MDSKYKKIIVYLKDKTGTPQLSWKEDVKAKRIVAEVGDFKVGISKLDNEYDYFAQLPGTITAELTFMDKDDVVFDKVTLYSTSSNDYKDLSQLYDIAYKSATGADKKIDSIIDILHSFPDPTDKH